MNPRYQTNMFLDEQDQLNKEQLAKLGFSPRDTWREGVKVLLKTVDKAEIKN